MRIAGVLLMPAGWAIALAAVALLPPGAGRAAFLFAGLAVEGLGVALIARLHATAGGDEP